MPSLLVWLQLWELLRYRNGQAPASGVVLLDDMRLLSTEELVVEHVSGLADAHEACWMPGCEGCLGWTGMGLVLLTTRSWRHDALVVQQVGLEHPAPLLCNTPGAVLPPLGSGAASLPACGHKVHVTSAVAQTEAQHRAAEALGAVALPSAAPPQVRPYGQAGCSTQRIAPVCQSSSRTIPAV